MRDEQFMVPRSLREQYYRDGYWRSEDLWASFATVAALRGEAIALVEGDRQITFANLHRDAERFGQALRGSGIRADEIVVVYGRHCLESSIAILGCAHAGVVVALLPHMFSTEQIRGVLDNCNAAGLVALGDPAEMVRAVQAGGARQLKAFIVADSAAAAGTPEVSWSQFLRSGNSLTSAHEPQGADELALLTFSSGTTGEPKGVMHSANTIRFTVDTYAHYPHHTGPIREWRVQRGL